MHTERLAKDLMIPLTDYPHIPYWFSVREAIAISLPVSLVIAKYLGVEAHVILFASLVVAGMPFNLLIGAAPNAIAYESKQFTTGEFFIYGWIPSVVLMVLLGVFCWYIWPLQGMPGLLK